MPSTTPAKRPNQVTNPLKFKPRTLEAIIPGKGNVKRLKASTTADSLNSKNAKVDASRTVTARGDDGSDVEIQDAPAEVITISSDEEVESEYTSSEDEEAEAAQNGVVAPVVNGNSHGHDAPSPPGDASMQDADEAAGSEDDAMEEEQAVQGATAAEADEPSFGEMLQNMSTEVVDVEAAFAGPLARPEEAATVATVGARSAPSAMSLGTVLTQALKTNDKELLESCFEINDLNSVRSTIERLPSPLVANLLESLAKRVRRRPGRAGNLLVWFQWSFVSHGGYLASQPRVMKRIAQLNSANNDRARSLRSLLMIKGKLDMLTAQVELRRSMQSYSRTGASDDDEEDVIYVEGEDDEEENPPQEAPATIEAPPVLPKPSKKRQGLEGFEGLGESESSGPEDAMQTTVNGVHSDEDEERDSDEDDELIDDEAEETDDDSSDEEGSEESEESDEEDLSESDEDSRPPKRFGRP